MRPVYTHHPRNFVFMPNARIGQAPVMQPAMPAAPMGQIAPGVPTYPPVRAPDDATPEASRVQIAWAPLIFAGVVGGAAFALGAGLINRFVFDK